MQTLYKADGTPINLLQSEDIEYGDVVGKGRYIKYPNGVMIQWGTVYKNINIAISTAMLYYDDGYVVELPKEFVGGYQTNIISSQKEMLLWVYSTSDFESKTFKFNLLSNAVQQGKQIAFDWIAIDRWK